MLAAPLQSEEHEAKGASGLLIHRTKVSGLRVGVAMNHDVVGPPGTIVESSSYPDSSIVSITARLEPWPDTAPRQVPRLWLVSNSVAAGDP